MSEMQFLLCPNHKYSPVNKSLTGYIYSWNGIEFTVRDFIEDAYIVHTKTNIDGNFMKLTKQQCMKLGLSFEDNLIVFDKDVVENCFALVSVPDNNNDIPFFDDFNKFIKYCYIHYNINDKEDFPFIIRYLSRSINNKKGVSVFQVDYGRNEIDDGSSPGWFEDGEVNSHTRLPKPYNSIIVGSDSIHLKYKKKLNKNSDTWKYYEYYTDVVFNSLQDLLYRNFQDINVDELHPFDNTKYFYEIKNVSDVFNYLDIEYDTESKWKSDDKNVESACNDNMIDYDDPWLKEYNRVINNI